MYEPIRHEVLVPIFSQMVLHSLFLTDKGRFPTDINRTRNSDVEHRSSSILVKKASLRSLVTDRSSLPPYRIAETTETNDYINKSGS